MHCEPGSGPRLKDLDLYGAAASEPEHLWDFGTACRRCERHRNVAAESRTNEEKVDD
jgi:hypothetical protein